MKFISGQLKLDVKYNDRTDRYQVRICPVRRMLPGEKCEKVSVAAARRTQSAHGKRIPVDDPRAMRNAAHAAISFARKDIQDDAATNRRGSGWIVKPPKRKRRR